MNTLQSVVLPNLEVPGPEELYLRLNPQAWADLGRPAVCFTEGGVASSDTFYSGLFVEVWKALCDVSALALVLEGHGEFQLSVGLHRFGQTSVWLLDQRITLGATPTQPLALPAWTGLTEGLLFFRLRALGPGELTAARYVTPQAPARDVRLGLVITHFNRQAQVLPAIECIRRSVLQRAELAQRATLTVVDNSANLPLADGPGVTRIANRNLGGTGGYVRGLLELQRSGTHSHALLMDDDASCEPEAIARTLALLQHGRSGRLAVAGALMNEAEPWQLLEKGACFDGLCRPLCSGMDMRHVGELMRAQRSAERPDYGGWWFFAFPLQGVDRFPFPFFVRGDDVFFSLTNRFTIATVPGIATQGEAFGVKHGP